MNIPTLIVGAIVAILFISVVVHMIKKKKNGGGGCSCGCGCGCDACSPKKDDK